MAATVADGAGAGAGPGGRLSAVDSLQEEAVCAICLDYFTDPVSIGCGHNFCRVCIAQLWGGDGDGDGDADGAGPGQAGGEAAYADGAAAAPAGDVGMGEELEDDELDEEDELDEDELDQEEEEEEEEEDDMWSEEDEDADLWEDAGEDDMWEEDVGAELFFGDDDYDEDVMEEEDLEVEVEEEEEEEEEEEQPPPPPPPPGPLLLPRPRRPQAFTCPQCRKTFPQRSFRPNLQLANMVQIIRQMHPHPQRLVVPAPRGPGGAAAVAPGGLEGRALCEKHQEPLKLFCEVDEQAICVVCRESRSHKHHSVVPLEEVVQDYKTKLQSHLEPLKKKLDAVLKQKSSEEEKITELKNKMKLEIKEFESDFELLHQFLIGEQVLLLHQLEERYEGLLARQSSHVSQLEEQSAALGRLIAEAEDKSKQDGLQLLKDIKGTFIRCESVKFQEPEMVPVDVGKKYRNYFLQDVVMRKMEKVFSKVPQADVTLDPDTAHPHLSLSLDRRSVKLGERRQDLPDNPKRFDSDYCVLGSQGFTTGRHYWEVEVGGRRGWAVGAARETARRKEKASGPHQKREIWCVGTNGKKYQALTATEQTALSPGEKPRRFGVYLDYERGQLCFYNAESMAHIHTFNATFRERIFPFFRILAKGTRIKICT
ncbi:E3 ubiquitin-protein ligase TRIM41 [Alligator mississippiensis]|uniref:E3 ubiquitin-protein ligase TRIM41 n=1 Tax=Alligator mississippiensis TaxID=8496 RepID=UPI00287773CF|nr:E3 ubiquitin-protein ligase TRIM41 [Alligator mississippiensis]